MMRKITYITLILLAACKSGTHKLNELTISKTLNVLSYADTAIIESGDFFDRGIADSMQVLDAGVSLKKMDSSRYVLIGGNLPYAVIRAFQGETFLDILTHNKAAGFTLNTGGISFSTTGISIEIHKPVKQLIILQDNRLLMDTSISSGILDVSSWLIHKKGRSHIRVFASSDSGIYQDLLMPLADGKPIEDAAEIKREDLHGNVMYFAFLDRFKDGNSANNRKVDNPLVTERTNYHGGDIKGVGEVIQSGYFNRLGINSLWISPITRNPDGAWGNFKDPHVMFSGYHGYWPSLSTVIDPRMGTEAELHEALKLSHDSGINVLLDYVAHHVHKEHPIYKKHADWVTPLYLPDGSLNTERWDDHRLTTWFDTFMPTLDLGRPEIASYMVDSALFWLKQFDFDGFRHDATKHIPENFTRLLTKRIRSQVSSVKGKHRYQIGETYGDPALIASYVGSGLLDAQFDFNLYDRMVDVFAFGDGFERLYDEQKRSLESYGSHHLMGNISGNQDRTRFMSFADGSIPRSTDWMELKRIGHLRDLPAKGTLGYERFALFYAYQMCAPGIPVIYYGDEYGMTGANDPGNRNPMKFDGLSADEVNLKKWVSDCISFRRTSMALMYGDFEIVYHDVDRMVVKRSYRNETVICVINRSKDPFYWEPKGGMATLGKLTKRISNGKEAYKNLWTVSPNAAAWYQLKK